jgi:hypothetical protein
VASATLCPEVAVRAVPAIALAAAAVISTALPSSGASASPAGHARVWFAPLPPMPLRPGREYVGSVDFMKLFSKKAPWASASRRVNVFKLYGEWIEGTARHGQLARVVADLKRRRIALAVEAGPLQATSACGGGVEGFNGPASGRHIAQRIKAAHGTLAFVALDEPFYYANVYDGPNACHWSAEQIAVQVRDFVAAVRAVFPRVVVGDIEPLAPDVQVDQLVHWLDAYHDVTGSSLPFFHLDVGFLVRQDWPQAAKALEGAARARGVPFGLIYNGDGETDRDWAASAEQRFTTYEAQYQGQPDDVIFQSWVDHPDYVLPESRPGTFTNLIDRYLRPRTALRLDVNALAADGTLVDAHGQPLPGRPIELSLTPLDGPGGFADYVLTGSVPAGAATAVVGFRVNMECFCAGSSDFRLDGVRYAESGGPNRVANPGFDQGWTGWGAWGDGSVSLEASDRGGLLLHASVSAGQFAALNSAEFPVTGGGAFAVDFSARVALLSRGSGYFTVIFLGPTTEVARRTVPLAPAVVSLGTVSTAADGSFHMTLNERPAGTSLLEAWYRGDDRHFPAYAGVILSR